MVFVLFYRSLSTRLEEMGIWPSTFKVHHNSIVHFDVYRIWPSNFTIFSNDSTDGQTLAVKFWPSTFTIHHNLTVHFDPYRIRPSNFTIDFWLGLVGKNVQTKVLKRTVSWWYRYRENFHLRADRIFVWVIRFVGYKPECPFRSLRVSKNGS